jgi:hypothetical protein
MINCKSSFVLTCTFILLSLNLFSQDNYQPGFIVQLSGDTLNGFIDYRNWGNNPDKIEFRQSTKGPVTVYRPLSIREFGVAGEIYLSAIIETETSPSALNNLDVTPELKIITDTAFIMVLIRGNKSLLSFRSNSVKDNFYIEENGNYTLLRQKKYLSKAGNKTVVVENKKYIGQLRLYLTGCGDMDSRAVKLEYINQSLTRYFNAYYDCIKGDTVFEMKNQERIKLSAGVSGGITSTSIYLLGTSYYPDPVFKASTDFTGAIFLDCILGRDRQKWSIYNELNYTSFKFETTYPDYLKNTLTTKMNFDYIKLVNMLRFSYPVYKVRVFVNAGVSNGIAFEKDNSVRIVPKNGQIVLIRQERLIKEIRKLDIGFLGGAGIQYKKLSGEIRYENSSGMSPYVYTSSDLERLYFILAYRIL